MFSLLHLKFGYTVCNLIGNWRASAGGVFQEELLIGCQQLAEIRSDELGSSIDRDEFSGFRDFFLCKD